MSLRSLWPVLWVVTIGWSQTNQVAYVKYYRDRTAFLGDIPLPAHTRHQSAHLDVYFNEQDQPLLLENISASGDTVERKVFAYGPDGALTQTLLIGGDHPDGKEVTLYGEGEPWSVAFRKAAFAPQLHLHFAEQRTRFRLDSSNRIQSLTFYTVNGFPYGQITFVYGPGGYHQEERWETLPDHTVIRRYVYTFNEEGVPVSLTEYGRGEQEISRVDLTQAPADQLYRLPPPRVGNRLEEAEDIIESIRSSGVVSPIPARIPVLPSDMVQLRDGQLFTGSLLHLSEQYLQIVTAPRDTLQLPVQQIYWARIRSGEYLIYPTP